MTVLLFLVLLVLWNVGDSGSSNNSSNSNIAGLLGDHSEEAIDFTDATSTCESNLKDTKRYCDNEGPDENNAGDNNMLRYSWNSNNFLPVYLLPSLAGTRLRTWSRLDCKMGPKMSHFHVGGSVWLDIKRSLIQTKCWIDCMKLNPDTQDDDNCMTRPDEGIDAVSQVDESLPTGFLLKSLIQMLASKGYEPEQSMFAHPYDWRLPPGRLEERDAAFSRLKRRIEGTVAMHKKRNPGIPTRGVMLVGLSLGNLFIQYFFNYLKAELGERGLERWADEYVHGLVLGGSPFLGAPGPIQSLLVGATMGLPIKMEESREMYLTFGSMPWVLPVTPKTKNKRHSAMNHGEEDFPVRVVELTKRNGTRLRPRNEEIVHKNGFFGKIGDEKLDSVQRNIEKWYIEDNFIGGGSPMDPWTPPKGIDQIICVYGVNVPTPVGYRFREHPQYNGRYEESDVLLNDRGDILDKNGENVLPKNRRFATRTSGDGTVPYFSLSWCHSWFGSDLVNITRVPAHRKYEEDDIEKFNNVDVFNTSQVREIERRPHGYNTFYSKRWTEDHPDSGMQRLKSIQVWELDGIIHKDTVTDKRFMHMFQSMMSGEERWSRMYMGIRNRMIVNAREEIEKSGILENYWDAKMAQDGASFSGENIPTNDDDCYWDYANVECAWRRYCVYEFRLGDVHLSMSCRLRKIPLTKDDPELLLRETDVLNETLHQSDGTEWRVVYRDKDKGMFAPWVYVFLSFICGATVLGVFIYFIVWYNYDLIVNQLQSRSPISSVAVRVEGLSQSDADKGLIMRLSQLMNVVKELEGENQEGIIQVKHEEDNNVDAAVSSSNHSDLSTVDRSSIHILSETVDALNARVEILLQASQAHGDLSILSSSSHDQNSPIIIPANHDLKPHNNVAVRKKSQFKLLFSNKKKSKTRRMSQ